MVADAFGAAVLRDGSTQSDCRRTAPRPDPAFCPSRRGAAAPRLDPEPGRLRVCEFDASFDQAERAKRAKVALVL